MSLKNKYFCLFIIFVACLPCLLQAQNATASPYSMYGLGEINYLTSGRVAGMGGASVGLRSPGLVNHTNPASYTAIDSLSFVFDVSVSGKSSKFTFGQIKHTMQSANIFKMAFAFRVNSKWASSVGILPYSSVGYNLSTSQDVEGSHASNTIKFKGSGGINKIYWGNAYSITPHLTVGMNASFLFGSIVRTETQGDWDIDKTLRTHKFYLDFGLQYEHLFTPRLAGVFGLTYGYKSSLHMNSDVEITSSLQSIFSESNRNETLYLPEYYGVGFLLSHRRNIQLAGDYTFQKWSVIPSSNGATFKDAHRFNLGASIIPDAMNPKSYFDLVEYQIGVSLGNSYISFNDATAMQRSFSMGLGLPIGSSVVDIVYEYGVIGNTGYKQLKENYHKITIGLTLKETWFYKFLYQ